MTGRRVAVVTGANTGVGFEVARQLALPPHSMHVCLACRSLSRGQDACARIEAGACAAADGPTVSLSALELDLANLDSVSSFCARLGEEYTRLDVLVNNAGLGGMNRAPEPVPDAPASDLVMRTNFLGHFLLTLLLLPLLERGGGSRIINTSSVMHRQAHPKLDWEEADWEEALSFRQGKSRYCASKLAMHVFSVELMRRLSGGITAISVNPGAVNSDIWYRGQLASRKESLFRFIFRFLFLEPSQGAAPAVSAATDPEWEGEPALYLTPYYTPRARPMPFELLGPFVGARPCKPHRRAIDPEVGMTPTPPPPPPPRLPARPRSLPLPTP